MTTTLYTSTPSRIEALQWDGHSWEAMEDFTRGRFKRVTDTPLQSLVGTGSLLAGKDGAQGWVDVPPGHWVVRQPGDYSDHWPVDNAYFMAKYQRTSSGLWDAFWSSARFGWWAIVAALAFRGLVDWLIGV